MMIPPVIYPLVGKRIFVAGHRGMVGSAILRRLEFENSEVLFRDRVNLDLRDQAGVLRYLRDTKPDAVVLAAARVGGIRANASAPATFLSDNLAIQQAVIGGAFQAGVEKLLFLGSSCIYPKHAPQPIPESAVLTSALEPTNEAYAIAKIAGLKLCAAYRAQYGADYISAMPTNLYGPNDNFDLETGHVLPALIRKAHEAKMSGANTITIWGSGTPRREFLHVDDCADALVHLLKTYSENSHINVGTGKDLSILELVNMIAGIVGFEGKIETDASRPDGTPRKLLSIDRLASTGWTPTISLRNGIARTYEWYCQAISARVGLS